MNVLTLVYYLCLIVVLVSGTASKSNNDNTDRAKKDVFQRSLVIKDIHPKDILDNDEIFYLNTSLRHYVSGEFLGYVTPWNDKGYKYSNLFHGKFDLISPVWLTVKSSDPFNIPTHDIHKKWFDKMRKKNTEYHYVKILPRVMFEGWSKGDIISFHNDKRKWQKLTRILIDLAEAYSFDGYVLEAWNQFVFSGAKKKYITSLINNIAEGLRLKNLDTVLAVPPLRGLEQELFTKKDFDTLSPYIRYFSLMTYDYSNVQRPGPNAPTEWIRKCIKYLVPDNKDIKRSQILMGLNFYGYHYTPEGGKAIVSSEYREILDKLEGKLRWDDKSEEHFFEVKSDYGGGFVFYPTLYSLMLRLELANELKTGVAVWELGQGLTYFFDLL